MARIEIVDVAHSYDQAGAGRTPDAEPIYALKRLNLVWEDGKTYALLGPSGCGKTTMLNIISGLIRPTTGRLLFDGVDVTDKTTAERNIAQVFQFPVIYTTMTVAQNLAFPLVCKKFPSAEISKRVDGVAALLGLTELMRQPAKRLTADQKQLVSLGRGLVRNDVSAILLDEPLTVIDPQMKFDVRRKLKQINREFGTTMVFVTHDQTEAMTFAEEVVVMKDGEVMQQGSPQELFERPDTLFVGYFIGSPPMNSLRAEFHDGALVRPDTSFRREGITPEPDAEFHIGFRAEFVKLGAPEAGDFCVAEIVRVDYLGVETVIAAQLPDGRTIRAKKAGAFAGRPGDRVGISISDTLIHVYRNGRRLERSPSKDA